MRAEHVRPFAQGLLEAAGEQDLGEQIQLELDRVAEVLEPMKGLDGMLRSGVISDQDLAAALDEATRRLQICPLTRRFLGLLQEKRVLDWLPRIAREYGTLLERGLGRTTAKVASAVPLTEEERERLQTALRRRVGRHIRLEQTVDPDLLGGLVVRVGDLVLDGSLRMRLERVRIDLARG